MKFAIPRIWRQLTDHSSSCYFCMVDPTKRRTGKDAPQIVYPDIPSSIAPIPHCPEPPVPTSPKRDHPSSEDSSKSDSEEDIGDLDYVLIDVLKREGHTSLTRKTSTILSETLGLPSPMLTFAELLISRLKRWNVLDESMQVTDQRKLHETFSNFFSRQDGLCFCNNVAGLFETIGIICNPSEWRLFIDISSRSLKAVLLYNRTNYPSLPKAHSVHLKE